jgi:hypothetical protein
MIPEPPRPPERTYSFLIADCGTSTTTVVLIETVGNAYRIIAKASVPTTAVPPWNDISQGVQQAILQITETTGRTFLNDHGVLIRPTQPDYSGVDRFALVSSAASPLRTLLIGLFEEVSLASARKALRSIYYQETDTFSLSDPRSEQEQVANLLQAQPDLYFITGGTDGGAENRLLQLIELASLGIKVHSNVQRPQLIYAGNINLREPLRQLVGENATIHVANNVRPSLETEQLEDVIRITGELYEDLKIKGLSGIHELVDWSSYPILPTARAFAGLVQYIAALNQQPVLGIDLGSNSLTFTGSDGHHVQLSIHTDLGLGRPIRNLLHLTEPEKITQWVPSDVTGADAADYVLNKSLYPNTIPMIEKELHLEQAAARELLRIGMERTAKDWNWTTNKTSPFKLLLVRGSLFANTPRAGQNMLLLLDALQPTGIFSIALDQYSILPALGALAAEEPSAVVQVLETEVLANVGWVIAPTGKGQIGKTALHITIEMDGATFTDPVEYGNLENIPIAPGKEAKITIQPTGNFDIGLGSGNGTTITVYGGTVGGLVVDARGRPLTLPDDEADRRSLVRKWLWDLGG